MDEPLTPQFQFIKGRACATPVAAVASEVRRIFLPKPLPETSNRFMPDQSPL